MLSKTDCKIIYVLGMVDQEEHSGITLTITNNQHSSCITFFVTGRCVMWQHLTTGVNTWTNSTPIHEVPVKTTYPMYRYQYPDSDTTQLPC